MTTACENPFRVQRIHALDYRLEEGGWDGVLTRLAAMSYHAAVVGPHGHGKSAFLRALAPILEARGFHVRRLFLNDACRSFDPDEIRNLEQDLGHNDMVFLDGCEQLSARAWRRFLHSVSAAGGLVITTHTPGRLPTLLECRTSSRLLQSLLQDLGATSWLEDDQLPARLFDQHHGNLRAVFFALYDCLVETAPESPVRNR